MLSEFGAGFSLSPALDHPLAGYPQELVIPAGERLDLRCSGAGTAHLRIVRLIHGDPNPDGPGYRDEPAAWSEPQSVSLEPQRLNLGSFAEIPSSPAVNPAASFTLGIWIRPTRLTGDWRCVAAKWDAGSIQYGLFTVGNGVLVGAVSTNGHTVAWCTSQHYLALDAWQFVAMVHDAGRGLLSTYHHCPMTTTELSTPDRRDSALVVSTISVPPGSVFSGDAALLLGALARDDGGHWAHFDGKLARPFLADGAWSLAELESVVDRGTPVGDERLLAAWDLSREVSKDMIDDVSGGGTHGRARGCPTRAATGPAWSGTLATLYTDAPASYDAIHLHCDDLDDAAWESTALIDVPGCARPGIYAARLTAADDSLVIPFVVTPSAPTSELCVLLPTLTWQAYSSNRGPYSFTEDGVIDQALCLYDVHSDGTVVNYCTRRKPTRSGNPSRGLRTWGAHNLPADLYLLDWLEWEERAYDVLCDQQLHTRGAQALAPYRCVILGSHPEYWTAAMLNALESYLSTGGRVMYLGGNGLYWVTSLDPERPHVMEVRKSGDGDFESSLTEAQPGQLQHSTTLEIGGLWSRRGRPARRLVGIEHAANVFVDAHGSWGFERLPASHLPEYGFAFEGVTERVIGDFGLNLGTAAAYEVDATHDWMWGDRPSPTVLARASHPRLMSTMRLPIPRAAEIAFTEHPGGGAVFAAGSVTWTGSLSHNGYVNNVSRVSRNVLQRFLDAPRGRSVLEA